MKPGKICHVAPQSFAAQRMRTTFVVGSSPT
jgi:hypothetical protein